MKKQGLLAAVLIAAMLITSPAALAKKQLHLNIDSETPPHY